MIIGPAWQHDRSIRVPDSSVAVGCDVVSVRRLEKAFSRQDKGFLDSLFSPEEQELAAVGSEAIEHRLAHGFAVKESVMKALGYGLGQGLAPRMIEISDPFSNIALRGFAHSKLAARCIGARSCRSGRDEIHALCLISPTAVPHFEMNKQMLFNDRSAPLLECDSMRLRVATSHSSRVQGNHCQNSQDVRQLFSPGEIDAQRGRRNSSAALGARLIVKRLVIALLRDAGLGLNLPANALQIEVEPGGKPTLRAPVAVAQWMLDRGLGLSLSLSHAGQSLMGAAVLARNSAVVSP